MPTLTATQIKANAVTAYSDFLTAGLSYGDAMRAAAKALGDTPCITFLDELAKVHATKYGCNYTWNTAGTAVFYTGEESTRESRHGAAFQSWRRNVMVWFTPEKTKGPAKSMRVSTEARALAMDFLGNFEGKNLEAQIKAAVALLNALK
jgi:hypothetical protein